jgi:hypothetical protein
MDDATKLVLLATCQRENEPTTCSNHEARCCHVSVATRHLLVIRTRWRKLRAAVNSLVRAINVHLAKRNFTPTRSWNREKLTVRQAVASSNYWRRGQDSNLQGLSPGGFQDRFLTIRIPLLLLLNQSIGERATSVQDCRIQVIHPFRDRLSFSATFLSNHLGRTVMSCSVL